MPARVVDTDGITDGDGVVWDETLGMLVPGNPGAAALSDDAPLEDGTADPGVSTEASRSDHVHPDAGGGGDGSIAVSDGGTEVVPQASELNFGDNLSVVDDGYGQVTINAAAGGGGGLEGDLVVVTGEAVIADPDTSVVVPHGVADLASPSREIVQVTPTNALGAAAKWWLAAVDATNITIAVDAAPGVGATAEFVWRLLTSLLKAATGGDTVYEETIGADTWRIHIFNEDGQFQVNESIDVEYLIIGGGGGGQHVSTGTVGSGGGGAGGYRCSVVGETTGGGGAAEPTQGVSPGAYPVVVGSGGTGYDSGNQSGQAGGDSSVFSIIAKGGQGGVGTPGSISDDPKGDAGGGDPTQGYEAGDVTYSAVFNAANPSRGGGGAGAKGGDATSSSGPAADGGAGLASSITGVSIFRGGGGGGGRNGGTQGQGGQGGGGDGGSQGDGAPNTGGGGGGTNSGTGNPGNGGSGVVILRYKI